MRLSGHHALVPPHQGWKRIGANITDDGRLLVAWAEPDQVDRQTPRGIKPADIDIVSYDDEGANHLVTIRRSTTQFPCLDLLPDGNIIVVDARCVPGPDGALADNASVHDAAGEHVRSFHLGDGIETVQCTPSGRVWVGYFDEGVFGNDRWGKLLGTRPPASFGVAQFDEWGTFHWAPASPAIADIYALNVHGEVAWACPYRDFPILRMETGRTVSWSSGVTGPNALVVRGDNVALIGGYEPFGSRVVGGTLTTAGFDAGPALRLELPDGSPIPTTARMLGRGSRLVVLTETGWHSLSIDALLA